MTKAILTLALASLAAGCTSISTPDGWKYRSTIFEKKFEELTVALGTNGLYTIHLKGYSSDAKAVAEAVASGITKGITGSVTP